MGIKRFYGVSAAEDETKNGLYFGSRYQDYDEDWKAIAENEDNYYKAIVEPISAKEKKGFSELSEACAYFKDANFDLLKRGEVIKLSLTKEALSADQFEGPEDVTKYCCEAFSKCHEVNKFYAIEYNSFAGESVFDYEDYPSVLYYWIKYGLAYITQYQEVYKLLFDYLNGETPNILSVGFGAGQDFFSAVKQYDGPFEYTGCDINDWNVRFVESSNCKPTWIIGADYVKHLKEKSKGKKNILFFPRVLSEISTKEGAPTEFLMEEIIENIELATEGVICVYTRQKKDDDNKKFEYEYQNINKIAQALVKKGFKIEILKDDAFETFERLEDENDLQEYIHRSSEKIDGNWKEVLGTSYDEYQKSIGEIRAKFKDMNLDKTIFQEPMTTIKKYGGYYIIRFVKE